MNSLTDLFKRQQNRKILSMYLTAGFPTLKATVPLAKTLVEAGADLLEIGIPFSDPIADGPTIQRSNSKALANGFDLDYLFSCMCELNGQINAPIVLMGHLNPILHFGVEKYLKNCLDHGICGSIIPDMPVVEYRKKYQLLFQHYQHAAIFLITSETTNERIHELDSLSSGFLYVVSSPAITGGSLKVTADRDSYFARIEDLKLKNPLLVGFGIDSRETFEASTKHTAGAIIASAYLRELEKVLDPEDLESQKEITRAFVSKIRGH
jgi:tryptophan synthase alpha chain